jgi:hypothetical protein
MAKSESWCAAEFIIMVFFRRGVIFGLGCPGTYRGAGTSTSTSHDAANGLIVGQNSSHTAAPSMHPYSFIGALFM